MLGQLSRVLSRRTFAPLRRLGSWTGLTSPVGVAAEFGSAPTSASSAGADGTHQAGAELAAAHVPTSACEKVRLAVEAAFTAFLDPERDDAIATLGEVTGPLALQRMYDSMASDVDGARLLREQPRIRLSAADVARLATLPPGTFGRGYAEYLTSNGFDPTERKVCRFVDEPHLRYVMQRYREVHDFWHVLSGLPPSVVGEVALKWLEMVHTGLPMAALSALVAPARLPSAQRRALTRHLAPWAVRVGSACAPLMAVPYEELWEEDLASLRSRLRFAPAPVHVLGWAERGLV